MINDITKPELAYMNSLTSLEKNPSAPSNILEGTPVLDTLLQDRWKMPWEEVGAEQFAGKAAASLPSLNPGINLRRKYFSYEKPYCETETDEVCAPNICEGGSSTVEQMGYLASDIDQCISETWSIGKEQFLNLNETPNQRRANMLQRKAWNIKQKVNKRVLAQLYASVSDYSDGTASIGATTKLVNIISSEMKVSPVGLAKIAGEYRRESFTGEYVIFGGHTLADFWQVNRWERSPEGRLGTDLADQSLPFIYDAAFDTTFQNLEEDTFSHGVTVPIGSFGLDFYNEYTGYNVESFEDFIKTTILIDGLLYDYSLRYDKCDSTYTEQLKLNFGYMSLPDSIYCNGRAMIKHWKFGCGPVDCDTLCC